MAIVLRNDAPTDGPQAISSALADLAVFPAGDPMLGGAALDLSEPIAVFRLGLEDISSDPTSLEKAELTGWRYLLEQGDTGDVAYADVSQQQKTAKFVSISKNENAAALLDASHIAQDEAAKVPGDVEFRIIEVPSVKLSAVWLAHDPNIFIPYIDGAPNSTIKRKAITLGGFLSEIVDRAKYTQK